MNSDVARGFVRPVRIVGVTALAFAAFLFIHWRLSFDGNTYFEGLQERRVIDYSRILFDLLLASLRFLAAIVTMAALIVGARRRLTFALPLALSLILPALFGGVPDCMAFDQSAVPHGVGPGWSYIPTFVHEGCGYPLFAPWYGVAVDFALAVVPAILLAMRPGLVSGRSVPRVSVASVVIATILSAIGLTLLASVRGLGLLGYPFDWSPWLPIHLSLATFGAMLRMRRSWWSLALVVVPLAFYPLESGLASAFHEAGLAFGSELDLGLAAYPVLVSVLAACWWPLAIGIDKGRAVLHRRQVRQVPALHGS